MVLLRGFNGHLRVDLRMHNSFQDANERSGANAYYALQFWTYKVRRQDTRLFE